MEITPKDLALRDLKPLDPAHFTGAAGGGGPRPPPPPPPPAPRAPNLGHRCAIRARRPQPLALARGWPAHLRHRGGRLGAGPRYRRPADPVWRRGRNRATGGALARGGPQRPNGSSGG